MAERFASLAEPTRNKQADRLEEGGEGPIESRAHTRSSGGTWAWIVLLAGLVLSMGGGLLVDYYIARQGRENFELETSKAAAAILRRMQAYEQVLLGGAGIFVASREVSREEWHRYANTLELERRYPGIQGLGHARMIAPDQLAAHQEEIRAEGYPDYQVWPSGTRTQYSAIVYLEPFTGRNLRAFGYDMYAEPVRRAAMDQARDEGRATLSGRVILVQETRDNVQAGFLLYVPLYHWDQPTQTVAQRRAALFGYVYAPFRARDLMLGILGDADQELHFEVYDGTHAHLGSLLFDSDPSTAPGEMIGSARYTAQRELELPGRTWTVVFSSRPQFERSFNSAFPALLVFGGAALSLALFALLSALAQQKLQIERRATEMTAQLHSGRERFRQVVEATPSGLLMVDGEGQIVLANSYAEALFKRPREELLGMQVEMLMPPELRGRHMTLRSNFATTARRREMARGRDLYALRKDGTRFPVEIGLCPINSENGPMVLATVQDITARRRAEQALAEARTLLQGVIDAASEFSIIATDTEGLITLFNSGAERLLGYRAEEMVGRASPAVVHLESEVQQRSAELLRETGEQISGFEVFVHRARAGGSEEREWTYVRKDGSRVPVTLVVTAIRGGDQSLRGFIGVAYDITTRKQARETLQRAKDEAEAASRAKSEFLANMSHEIRTPLNAVLGIAQLLRQTELSAEQRESLEMILTSGRSLLGVLNDILDFSKIEAGRMELAPAPFVLDDLLDGVATIMSANVGRKPVELLIEVGADVPPALVGDALRLQQVLINLTGNAIKFTDTGEVVLTVDLEQAENGPHLLRFTVRDSGIGMNSDQLARLFAPFTQADGSTTRRYGGTGLGLVICRRLVELMGGQIEVVSTPGVGSRFSFVLPMQPRSGAYAEPPRLEQIRLLVADDHPGCARIIAGLARSMGAECDCAASADEAIALLQGGARPTALIVDVRLPGRDELLQACRTPQQPNERVLVLLAAHAGDRDGLLYNPATAKLPTLLKPVTRRGLHDAVLDERNRYERRERMPTPAGAGERVLEGVRILLVEDNDFNRKVACGLLGRAGAQIEQAHDGAAAVEAIRAHPQSYDLVLMDVQMPVLDGFAATRILRQELAFKRPIIAVTAGVTQAERDQCLACGMDDIVPKPLDFAQMLRLIERHLRLAPRSTADINLSPPSSGPPEIPGADMVATLRNLGDDMQLLRSLMESFCDDSRELAPRTRALLAAGKTQEAARLLHTLKGNAGTLGAKRVVVLAREAERLIKAESAEASAAIDAVDAELTPLLTRAQAWLSSGVTV